MYWCISSTPRSPSQMRSLMASAPNGTYPLVMPLDMAMRSGTTSQCSMQNIVPVRQKPHITSSAIISTSYWSQISLINGQYSSGGTRKPDAPSSGSAMNAATFSGPSEWMTVSRNRAQRRSHDGYSRPKGQR